MPLTRAEKEAVVATYQQGLARAEHAILVSYRGVSVPQVTELRDKIRASGGSYVVVKNRLALRAIEGAALEGIKDHFRGTIAIAYTDGDPVALAKVLADFSADVPALEFKAGLVEGQAVGAEQLQQIAELPGRDELIAKLLFLLQSPITRLVRTLGAIPRQLVTVLDQIAKSKSQG